MVSCSKPTPRMGFCDSSNLNEIAYLRSLVACLIADVKNLATLIQSPSKPPIFIPWANITNNQYINSDVDTKFVLYLNGVRFLKEGEDYMVLDEGGFQLLADSLTDTPNDYILIR